MELRHPWLYIQQELTKRWWTQKEFANILGKKVSEVNELIKGKRNITIQRDILLATIFDTDPKKWIGLQMEYDYQTESQSVDMQKITDIKNRKDILEDMRREEDDEILPNTVAMPEESSTIQDTDTPKKDVTKDRKKEHEIFRNF